MGKGMDSRAYLSVGEAMRVATLLGLHRMDEYAMDRLSNPDPHARRSPGPQSHDPLLIEETRRTMCVDRFLFYAHFLPVFRFS